MIVEESKARHFNCHYPDAMNCAGSSCMAWRWATEDNPEWVSPGMMAVTDPRKNSLFIRSKTHGYCGLAGQA